MEDQQNRVFVANLSKNPQQNHEIIATGSNNVNDDHHGSIVNATTDDDSTPQSNIDPTYDSEFESYPPGFRFKPHDEELILDYLQKKVNKLPLPPSRIVDVDLYSFNPHDLSVMYPPCGENEWYFFTSRKRKYPNGERPKRAAGHGYWKATGADRPIKHNGVNVGSRKALVFYMGNPPNGDKTDWIMHEFRVLHAPEPLEENKKITLDKCVLCRIYNKKSERFSCRFSSRRHVDEVETDSRPKSDDTNTLKAVKTITTPQMINQMFPIQTQMTPNDARFAQQFGSKTHMLTALPSLTCTTQQQWSDVGVGYYNNQNQIEYYSDFGGNIFQNHQQIQSNELPRLPNSFIQTNNPQLPFVDPDSQDMDSYISNDRYELVDDDNNIIDGFGYREMLMNPDSDSTAYKSLQFVPRQQ